MVGSALCRALEREGATLVTRERAQLDLTRQAQVEQFLHEQRIDQVYLAAAKVGGIAANDRYPASFIQENLAIECNVINASWQSGVSRLLFLGSSCIYPRDCNQPISEHELLNGPLEPTNEPYAIAKIAGIKLCESYNRQYGTDFRSVMPTNLYGPNDNFNLHNSHVLPALLRKFHTAVINDSDSVTVWGSGRPMREFLHVDDLAAACVHVMQIEKQDWDKQVERRCSHVNIGTGKDVTIGELATRIAAITGFKGDIEFDASKPDGTPRKLLDVSRLAGLGWRAGIDLKQGLEHTYAWMCQHWQEIEAQ